MMFEETGEEAHVVTLLPFGLLADDMESETRTYHTGLLLLLLLLARCRSNCWRKEVFFPAL